MAATMRSWVLVSSWIISPLGQNARGPCISASNSSTGVFTWSSPSASRKLHPSYLDSSPCEIRLSPMYGFRYPAISSWLPILMSPIWLSAIWSLAVSTRCGSTSLMLRTSPASTRSVPHMCLHAPLSNMILGTTSDFPLMSMLE